MPELPEVNTVQKIFESEALDRKIKEIVVHDGKILRNLDPDEFITVLTDRSFISTYRQGKFLFAGLDNGCHLLLHLGMTGDICYYNEPEDQPRHERFRFYLSDNRYLGFNDPRKFARILHLESLQDYIRQIKLGPDALRITQQEFLERIHNKKVNLKSFLLNQSNLAGIGNLYADEICYQCKVHPASQVKYLSKKLLVLIHQKMQEILQWACDQDAYYQVYPDDWFWKWRQAGSAGPEGKGIVKKATIAGRTTYFVDGWQKRY